MDHTSATPTRAKRPKQAKASREKIPTSGPRDPAEAAPPRATAAALLDDDDDAMDTAGGAPPAATVPSGTDAASFREGILTVDASGNIVRNDFDQDNTVAANLNKCKFVEEVVGPPISQQVSTLIVQVQPNKFRNLGGAAGIPANPADIDEYWRCPPHTPVFTNVTKDARPEDGVPRVISHVPDGLVPGEWFRFVGVTMEDGIMDVAAQKTHKRCAGKGRFTVAAKGTVTVNCSTDNLREAQFAYGDPFCISLYKDSLTGGVELTSTPGTGSIRSCAFGGRLESTKQRTFVYNKVGIRIGTFIMVEEFVEHGKVPTASTVPARWARSIIQTLCTARIEPVAAEVAASLGAIRTQVDLVGIRRKPNGRVEVVCVELKTTSKDERTHADGYDAQCRKMPTIHFNGKPLANTERNGHHIQAAFAPHGLLHHCPELADIDPRPSACVIVATVTAGLLYNVSPFPAAAYACSVEAPARVKRSMTANGFDRLPVGDGGRDIRACLKAAGHTKVTKSARASCASTVGGQRCLVAITGATAPSAQLEFRIRDAVKKTKGAARAAVVFRGPGGAGWRTKFLQ